MDTVQMFDPESGNWYEQTVSGSVPKPRKEYCLAGVASDDSTFEIFLYAGWGGYLGEVAVPYDSAYVLTIPGFHWVQASYPAVHPRQGLTCESVGGGQMLTIGGIDTLQDNSTNSYEGTFQTADPVTYGFGVFDTSTITWKDSFSSNQTVYTPSSEILEFYETNDRLSALNGSSPKELFSVLNFTGVPGTLTLASHSHSTDTGAIAGVGGLVGGVAGVVLVALAGFCFLKWRRRRETSTKDGGPDFGYHDTGVYTDSEVHREHELEANSFSAAGVSGRVELSALGKQPIHEIG